ncbi:pyroglutamyl-peptidase I [Ideonella sp. B508-1]|uniref:pyroglutamyl-peptidase I n=1 Tax=Ideonella sp. B508-1 TaxID=137716 RepID=UPI0003B68D81|nr:pyroglutamyl-peptidase I [Ideonella sp. B508-1]
MTHTVLLTGFEPFGGESINPSWEAVSRLDGWTETDFRVVTRCLPCEFGAAAVALQRHMDEIRPECVIAVGQAGGTTEVRVERVALNLDDAPIPDNAGLQPVDQIIASDGPMAYLSTLPVKTIVHELRAGGIPATLSLSAGSFVCNHVFFAALHHARSTGQKVRAGFIHTPYLPEQAVRMRSAASMDLNLIVRGLRIAVTVSVRTPVDLCEAGGQLN